MQTDFWRGTDGPRSNWRKGKVSGGQSQYSYLDSASGFSYRPVFSKFSKDRLVLIRDGLLFESEEGGSN